MKKRRRLRKGLAMLLTAAMVVGLLPGVGTLQVSATESDENTVNTVSYNEAMTPELTPEQSDGQTTDKLITAWQWIDEEEILDEETGNLALPGANEQTPACFDDVTAFLPTQIEATVVNAEDTDAESGEEIINLGDWNCEDYPEKGAYTGSYTFTAALPEGYALSEEAEALTVLVELGGVKMYDADTVTETGYENGFCTTYAEGTECSKHGEGCEGYQPAELVSDTHHSELNDQFSDYYAIENAGQLYWFAGLVNGTLDYVSQNTSANAVLTTDITVNKSVLDANGVPNSGTFTEWNPIGWYVYNDPAYAYKGTFDGNKHTISGLYYNSDSVSEVGLFGCSSGTIKNVGVVDSYFNGSVVDIGGVCGRNYCGTITNCYNTGTVSGNEEDNVGGVCGYNFASGDSTIKESNITNCYNTGTVSGERHVGGVCGYNFASNKTGKYRARITNCYSTGTVSGDVDSNVGGVCGYNSSEYSIRVPIQDCYYDNDVYIGGAVGLDESSKTTNVEGKSTDKFKSGEVAYLLNGGKSSDPLVWYQNLGEGGDASPVLDNTHGVVYQCTPCTGVYSNTQEKTAEHTIAEEGRCSVCHQKIICEVTLTATVDGDNDDATAASLTGAGSHNTGTDVTVTAPVKEGFTFKGWFAAGDTEGTAQSTEFSYTFTPEDDTSLVAVYEGNATEVTTRDAAKEALQTAILDRKGNIKFTLTGDALNGITADNVGEQGTALYTEALKHITAGEAGSNAKLGDYIAKAVKGYSLQASCTMVESNLTGVAYSYQVTYYTDKAQEDTVDSRLSEIYTSLQLSDSTLTDAQKVWKIYDWITNHVTYDYENLNDDNNKTKYTAYGALSDGKAVCQGFAGLFYRMCMDNGIDCRIVTGTADNGAHAWNIVKVGDNYYYIDATWDCKVLADEANGRQAKPGTLYYFLRSSLDNHIESETEKVTGDYPIAVASLAGIQIEIPYDVTKDNISSSVVLKDLCGTALTEEQLAWYQVKVTNDTTNTCKWSVTVTPGAVGLDSIALAEETVYTHGEADEDGNCTECNGKIKYIVAAYLYDVNGNNVAGVMTGLGAYLPEEEVTLTAPFVVGYNFVGWYVYSGTSANKYTGENLCTSRTYKFKASQDTNLVAVYKPIGSAGLTINGGKSFTINGDSKTTEVEIAYPLGSQITVVCNDDDFEYWKNSAGMVLSRDKSYTFTVTGKETISAVFNTIAENKATVVFESYYGQVIARDQYAAGAALTEEPGLPFRYGYTVLGWDYNGDGSYNAETDTFAKALERGFASEERHVTILPVYQLKDITYNITVENGTGTGAYKQNDVVTVVANAASEGNKFSHWADEAGNILSYNEEYQFYAAKNMKVTAVYVKIADMVETKGTTEIVDKIADREKEKLTFVSMSTVPEGCTINKAGMILTDDATVANGDSFNASTAKYVLGDAWSGTAYRYSVNISGVSAGVTWYVRAYLVYTDAEGNVYTIYGQMESLTM